MAHRNADSPYSRAVVFPDRALNRVWRVEAIGTSGQIQVAMFAGPYAKERAIAHAEYVYPNVSIRTAYSRRRYGLSDR